MADITYCANAHCLNTECDRHICRVPKYEKWVSVADFDATCEWYLHYYLLEEVQNNDKL